MIRDRWFFGRATRSFTLQWHLTNACPFHCRHCYDRQKRGELSLEESLAVLADMQAFCRKRRVEPRLSLSGGDPLCYSHFWGLYEAVARAGVAVSILGNPMSAENIARLLAVVPPTYYQVSLEGLRGRNDAVRGSGHFDLVMDFLAESRRRGLRTHVMLTLTAENLDDVLPLGEQLRGLTTRFTFNRLAQVGNAADMPTLEPRRFMTFLREYLAARRNNPVLGVKENLLSIIRVRNGLRPFPGCTGYGCGAAFNFVALLPDGEVHACRKFPSPIGNIRQSSLDEIYRGEAAARYRAGSTACRACRLRRRCGGCLAVTYGQGLDPLRERDPYCFIDRIEK